MEAFDVVETKRVPLDDFSMGEDSGWREHDADRVQQLIDIFKSGEYGSTTLSIPSVLMGQHGDVLLSREDGRYRINNGRSTISALKALKRTGGHGHEGCRRLAPARTGRLAPAGGRRLDPDARCRRRQLECATPRLGGWAPLGRVDGGAAHGLRTLLRGRRHAGHEHQWHAARCGAEQVCADELADQGADRSGAQGATPQLFNRTQSSQQKSVNQSGKPSLHNRPASPVASGPPHSRRS